jgi:hypothetical protein
VQRVTGGVHGYDGRKLNPLEQGCNGLLNSVFLRHSTKLTSDCQPYIGLASSSWIFRRKRGFQLLRLSSVADPPLVVRLSKPTYM